MDDMALVIGDHDSITLFGTEAQSDLQDVTKIISRILVNNNCNPNVDLVDIIDKIEKIVDEKKVSWIKEIPVIGKYAKKRFVDKYISIFKDIDDIALQLQLQQAQLLKNTKILEQEDQILKKCIDNLEKDIFSGKNILIEVQRVDDERFVEWSLRLQRKIQDLETTKIVSGQSRKQLQLMCMNNRSLIDKIVAVLSNTLPLWRNQISLSLGIEESDQVIKTQKKIKDLLQKHNISNIENRRGLAKKSSCKGEIDFEILEDLDNKLNDSLKELAALESKEHMFRIELVKTLS